MENLQIKDVLGYESLYYVDSNGNVYSKRKWNGKANRILKKTINNYGYDRVSLTDLDGKTKGITVHKIVTTSFIGERPIGMQVRHLDGNKTNNKLSNLCYGTALENANDRLIHGRTCIGEQIGSSKLSKHDVLYIKSNFKKRGDMVKMAKKFNVSCANIYMIINGKSRKNG